MRYMENLKFQKGKSAKNRKICMLDLFTISYIRLTVLSKITI